MGYRGKLEEQAKARELRAQGLTMDEIAAAVGVSKSSVSLWTKDVEFARRPRQRARRRSPNVLERRKEAEIARLMAEGIARVGELSRKEFLIAGAALYAGEGAKGDGEVVFANSDPRMIHFFAAGSGNSSISTRAGFGCGSTCTRGSMSMPQFNSGRS